MMRSPEGNHELRQLEGNAGDIWQRGDDWVKLADVMERTSVELGAIGDSSVHKSKGTEKLGEKAAENEDDLYNAAQRYLDTGKVLRTYADALEIAQRWLTTNMSAVETAENDYQSAKEAREQAVGAQNDLEKSWPWEEEPSPSELSAASSEVSRADTALTNATTRRDELWGEFDQVFEKWEGAYDDAVTGIQKAMDSSGTNDGFWEAVDTILNVIGVVLIVLSVIALIIGAPLTGLLGLAILGLTLLVVGLTALKFAFGRATLSDVAWSLVGLLPFGIGKVLSKGAPALSSVVRGGQNAITAAIRQGLPSARFLQPGTWHRLVTNRVASFFAPARAWLNTPKTAGMFVNPFRAMAMGSTEAVQVQSFLNAMRNTPWGSSNAVQTFIRTTTGQLPGRGEQILNVSLWTGFTGIDVSGVAGLQPEIPVLDDIQVPWAR